VVDTTVQQVAVLAHVRVGGRSVFNSSKFRGEKPASLIADGGVFDKGILIGNGCSFHGSIRLVGARVGGSLECRDTDIRTSCDADAWGLTANRAVVDSGVKLGPGLCSAGSICFDQARIIGDFDLEQVNVMSSQAFGIRANRLEVVGPLLIRRVISRLGGLSIRGARISGQVVMGDVKLESCCDEPALLAESAKIEESAYLSGGNLGITQAIGTVRLTGLTTGGTLKLAGLQITGPMANLVADYVSVEGGVDLTGGARVEGIVKLPVARVNGQLALAGLRVDNTINEPFAIEATSMEVRGEFITRGWKLHGPVCLAGSKATTLDDCPEEWPPDSEFGGFTYDYFGSFHDGVRLSGESRDFRRRMRWLERAKFDETAYQQLAQAYRKQGFNGKADSVAIKRKRRARSTLSPLHRARDWAFWLTAGYGYRPWRAGAGLVLAIAALALIMTLPAAENVIVPAATTVREAVPAENGDLGQSTDVCALGGDGCVNAVLYAADVVVPVLDLSEAAEWQISTRAGWGNAYEWTSALFSAVGWVLTSVFLLSFARPPR